MCAASFRFRISVLSVTALSITNATLFWQYEIHFYAKITNATMAVNGKSNIVLQLIWVYSSIVKWRWWPRTLRVNQVLYEAFRIICCIKPFKYNAMFVSWDTKLWSLVRYILIIIIALQFPLCLSEPIRLAPNLLACQDSITVHT